MSNTAFTFPSVQIPASNGITFTAKRVGQFPTITFVNGATAGSEVATVDSSFNISITIQSGVTTQTQVIAAITNSATPDSSIITPATLVSATTTHGSSTVSSFVKVPLTGGLAAAKAASLQLGGILYTAKTAGTGGNAITIQYLGDVAFTVTTVTDGTHLVVSSTTGLLVGSPITQGSHSTTVTTVTDGTHLIVGSTTGFVGSGAAASSQVVSGSEVVSVTSNAISVQIDVDVLPYTPFTYNQIGINATSNAQLQAAIVASTAANALVAITFPGGTQSALKGPKITQTPSPVSLSGGLAASAASTGAIQGITIVTATNGPTLGGTISMVLGGTAGSEVVTVTGNNVSVSMSATSTVTQIVTALQASSPFTALYTASGSAGTNIVTVFQSAMTGATSNSGLGFYQDQTGQALTTSFVFSPFNNVMSDISVFNDETAGSTKNVIYSWDGINNHGIILAASNKAITQVNKSGIYLKQANGAPAYRIIATNAW
jgi:hypothetical protein